jgi:hypothetical protein
MPVWLTRLHGTAVTLARRSNLTIWPPIARALVKRAGTTCCNCYRRFGKQQLLRSPQWDRKTLVLEKLLASEVLEVRVVDPALAHALVWLRRRPFHDKVGQPADILQTLRVG